MSKLIIIIIIIIIIINGSYREWLVFLNINHKVEDTLYDPSTLEIF